MNVTKEALERELELEKEMHTRGKERYLANIARLKENMAEGGTAYGKVLLKRGIEPLAAAITAFIERATSGGQPGRRHMAVDIIKGMAPDVVAFITLRTAIDTLTSAPMLQNVAVRVGREIEMEQRLENLKKNDADRYAMTQRYIQGHKARQYRRTVLRYAYGKSTTVDFKPWSASECLHVGSKLIELAIDSTGIFAIERKAPERKGLNLKPSYILTITPSLREWIDNHCANHSVLSPAYMPTLIPPVPWEGASGGGYYFQDMTRLSLVKTYNRDYLCTLDKRITNNEMPTVLRAINALQDTPWRINSRVYEVADAFWQTEGDVADMPPRDGYRLPPCPVCGADITDTAAARIPHACLNTLPEEELKRWRRAAAIVREKNIACMSRRLGIAKTLHLATRYKDEEAFYYPYQLDFRGRIYAVPAYLNPQGTGLAKALLQFAEGKALGSMAAVKWLAIHGSNCFGNDKVSLDARYSWVIQHQEDIRLCAEDPYGNRWWTEADDPWGFLAFCFEWQGYLDGGLTFVSHLPIAMDGTCNGLQIFSLILRDEVGGHAVNLTPTDTPQDIYGIVADKVRLLLEEQAVNPVEGAEVYPKGKTEEEGRPLYNATICARWLLGLNINRKMTKRQVMVLPYGGTFDSCREYTEAWLKEQVYADAAKPLDMPNGHTARAISRYLAELIWEAIGATVIKAREAMTFLQNTAAVLNRADLPIHWTTPVGFPVRQAYKQQQGKRVKTRIGDSLIYLTLNEPVPNSLAKPKQKSAVSPNYVHSLDAAALMCTVCRCLDAGVNSFAMIHDSYGTHAADSERLAAILRDVFVDLFGGEMNLLEVWAREVMAPVPDSILQDAASLPAVPGFGKLDVGEVRRSLFFFA